MFHLLCPGSGDCWKPGLRLCSLRRGSRTRGLWQFVDCGPGDRGSGDRDSGDRDSCSVLVLGFSSAPMAYLPIGL